MTTKPTTDTLLIADINRLMAEEALIEAQIIEARREATDYSKYVDKLASVRTRIIDSQQELGYFYRLTVTRSGKVCSLDTGMEI